MGEISFGLDFAEMPEQNQDCIKSTDQFERI